VVFLGVFPRPVPHPQEVKVHHDELIDNATRGKEL